MIGNPLALCASASINSRGRSKPVPIEENLPRSDDIPQQSFALGQEVFDKEGKKIGKVQARFSHYILVERGRVFVKAYYIPHSALSARANSGLRLSLSEDELREKGLNRVPDDLYSEPPEVGVPDVTGVAQFARGPHPLSPAETGHYSYGRFWPGMNTDASGSYRREEVVPEPQKAVGERIYTTDVPIPPREVSPD
jgi:hypothetical protein